MIRRVLLETRQDFTFEAVLSTERNLLLEEAKKQVSNLCSICAYKGQFGQCAACTDTCLQSTAYS